MSIPNRAANCERKIWPCWASEDSTQSAPRTRRAAEQEPSGTVFSLRAGLNAEGVIHRSPGSRSAPWVSSKWRSITL